MLEPIKVNMAEYKVGSSPAILACIGLGSCIGIVLYDRFSKVGGLAHIMLPNSQLAKGEINKAKYADTAIDLMISHMEDLGAVSSRMKAKIFGGGNMFPNVRNQTMLQVGEKNIEAVKEELKKRKIPLIASEIGGSEGRTIFFYTETGDVKVRKIRGEGERVY